MKQPKKNSAIFGCGLLITTLLLTGCGSTNNGTTGNTQTISQADIDKAMTTPTTLTFWSWTPNVKDEVALFEKKYPAIKVIVENVGQGAAHYQKLRTALQAGTGAPDVAQLEFQYISSFTVTNSLLNLTPYGANNLASSFVPWVWNQVKNGDAVYGMPWDSGPMGNLYRKDILTQAGITTAPQTWNDYATAAAAVKSKTGAFMSNLASNDAGQLLGLMWAAGVKPFGFDGSKAVKVNVNGPEAKKLVAYWQTLIQNGSVSTDPDFTDNWYQGLASGKYAGWLTAAWGPVFLQGTAAKTTGLWNAAKMPQTTPGVDATGNWGGSSMAVLKTTKNAIAAYEFAKFLNIDPTSTLQFANQQFLFPATTATLSNPAFANKAFDFYGGQKVNSLFADIAKTVDTKFEWLPYMDYAYSSYNETMGKALADKGDLSAGLDAWQRTLIDYGTQQGFSVNK